MKRILLPFFLCFVLSCSGMGAGVMPGTSDAAWTPSGTNGNDGIDNECRYSRLLWGSWDVEIKPGSANIIPLRTAEFTANIVNFLQPPKAPINLMTIAIDPLETVFSEGYIVCDVTLTHPFPGSAFCGFDVHGIILDDWEPTSLGSDPEIRLSLPPDLLLQNPDGYTRWWNQAEFTTYGTLFGYIEGAKANPSFTSTHTINAYKVFADSLVPDEVYDPLPGQRSFFSSADPGHNTRRYRLQFPVDSGPVFNFKYAVSVNYAGPISGADPPYAEDDYPIEASMPEAYKISVIDNGSDIYYENTLSAGGDLRIFVEIRDWQVNGNAEDIPENIAGLTIESPTLFPDPIDLDIGLSQIDPENANACLIPVKVKDVTPSGTDNQFIIVTVKSENPSTYEPQIPGITGFEFPDGQLAAYNVIEIPVLPEKPEPIPPVADASESEPLTGDSPLDVSLDPSASYDPDGEIELYEWDFESDGIFDVSTYTPDIVSETFMWDSNMVTLRVTDDDALTDIDEIEINPVFVQCSDWYTLHGDYQRTGKTDLLGPVTNHVKFTWEVPYGTSQTAIVGGIVLDCHDRPVFFTDAGYIVCLEVDGAVAWEYPLEYYSGWEFITPTVAPDGSIFIAYMSNIYHISTDGDLISEWDYDFWPDDNFIGGSILQPDGSMLVATQDGLCSLLSG